MTGGPLGTSDPNHGVVDVEPPRIGGSHLERALFHHRPLVLAACFLVTVILGFSVPNLRLGVSFESLVPQTHLFLRNYAAHRADIHSQSNALRIVLEDRSDPTVFNRNYLDTLQRLNDAVFLLPGVDRAFMKSLWTTSTRWISVTEEGFSGGPVIPPDYDGSIRAVDAVHANVERSGEIGQLVAPDLHSSLLLVPLLERDPDTGATIDYRALSRSLEALRATYSSARFAVHITGFAKIMGDMIEGLRAILGFFLFSIAIATGVLYWYTRCVRSTALVVACSLVAVLWQLGALPLLGLGLDPYSVLVPFLVFAIGMSHGAQKMNGVMQDIGRGMSAFWAARMTFRRLFIAGLTALMCDAVGFAVLFVIPIASIRALAVAASLGVVVLVVTNLILLPILLSYVGVSRKSAERSVRGERAASGNEGTHPFWSLLSSFARPRRAAATLAVAAVIVAATIGVARDLKVGDLDPGAPELRPGSRYNLDNAYLNAHYAASSDVLTIMVTTPRGECAHYDTERAVDRLEWQLRQLPGVEGTYSLADLSRRMTSALNEASPLWLDLIPNQMMLNSITQAAPRDVLDAGCDLLPVYVFLRNHKAETLSRLVTAVKEFATNNDTAQVHFLLAAGNAGVEAATNEVVEASNGRIVMLVYVAVALLGLLTFRRPRAVVIAILPLMLTSLLAEALMVKLGIGVKVATLPVTALGIGIGIDYALYVFSVTLAGLRLGLSLEAAYLKALLFTGRIVLMTGLTLSAAVATWIFSPIRFQADMGLLLAFMFLCNMIGALVLMPALACFLLRPVPSRVVHRATQLLALRSSQQDIP